jgi:uncharacterized membrane protein
MLFLALKVLHVLSVVLFLGNIITGVFWKVHADRIGDARARWQALDGIIGSDRWFTTPNVFVIVITGVAAAYAAGLPILGTPWILWSIVLFGISGGAFAFVAPLQKKLRAVAAAGIEGTFDTAEYQRLSNRWGFWGAVATLAPIGAVVLMVMKNALTS